MHMSFFRYSRLEKLQEQNIESRELLFCFAWMLHCWRVIERIKDDALKRTHPLKILMEENFFINSQISSHASSEVSKNCFISNFKSLSAFDQASYASWLMNKIELEVACMKSANQKKIKSILGVVSIIYASGFQLGRNFFSVG